MTSILSITSDRGLGGISASLLTYSRAMAIANIRHIVVIPQETPVYEELAKLKNVEIIPISSSALRAHSASYYFFSRALRKEMTNSDRIFIHNAKHSNVPQRFRDKTYVINHTGKTKLLDKASNIIFLNKTARDAFLKAFPKLKTPHLVVGHGFQVSDEIIREPDCGKPVNIISAGRLLEKKGFRELIDTARILQSEKVNCKICVYGEGPDETLLKQKIADYELNNIQIKPWTNNLREAMSDASIFCTPSHGESFPLVIGEALEAGLAIATTNTNGAKEYFSYAEKEKPFGLMANIKDPKAMASILKEIVQDQELRQRMNENARTFLLENFSLEILADKFLRICEPPPVNQLKSEDFPVEQ